MVSSGLTVWVVGVMQLRVARLTREEQLRQLEALRLEREETAAAYLSQHTEAHDVGEDDGVWDEYEQGEEESDEEELREEDEEGEDEGGGVDPWETSVSSLRDMV